jgi:hypothetical protein
MTTCVKLRTIPQEVGHHLFQSPQKMKDPSEIISKYQQPFNFKRQSNPEPSSSLPHHTQFF